MDAYLGTRSVDADRLLREGFGPVLQVTDRPTLTRGPVCFVCSVDVETFARYEDTCRSSDHRTSFVPAELLTVDSMTVSEPDREGERRCDTCGEPHPTERCKLKWCR